MYILLKFQRIGPKINSVPTKLNKQKKKICCYTPESYVSSRDQIFMSSQTAHLLDDKNHILCKRLKYSCSTKQPVFLTGKPTMASIFLIFKIGMVPLHGFNPNFSVHNKLSVIYSMLYFYVHLV